MCDAQRFCKIESLALADGLMTSEPSPLEPNIHVAGHEEEGITQHNHQASGHKSCANTAERSWKDAAIQEPVDTGSNFEAGHRWGRRCPSMPGMLSDVSLF